MREFARQTADLTSILTLRSLNPKEQQELNARMEKRQMKEFMTVR